MEPQKSFEQEWHRSTTRRFLLWLSSWKTLRRLTLIFVSLATLVALFYAVENWRGKHAWNAHVRALGERHESVHLSDLTPPPVPGQENLAEAPLFLPLFAYTQQDTGVVWADAEGKKQLEGLKSPGKPGRGRPSKCVVGSLAYDCWTDLNACLHFYTEDQNPKPELKGETDAAKLLSYLARYDALVSQLKEAAHERSACRFPVQYSEDMPFAILLPHLAPVKGLATLLDVRAIALLQEGDSETAYSDLETALRLSHGISREPILISHLVRLVSLNLTLQVIREGIARQAWSEPQLRSLQSQLASTDLLGEAKHALNGERACAIGCIDYLRRQGFGSRSSELGSEFGSPEPGLQGLFSLFPDGWFYQAMLVISRLHEKFVFGAIDVSAHRINVDAANAFEPYLMGLPVRPTTIFVKMLMPALSKALIRVAQGQSYVDMARVACAIERRRLAGQPLPSSLQELVPDFLDRVPSDVVSGQPLRYLPGEKDTYVIYAVGWNKQDDGGQVGWEGQDARAELKPDQGDWVWHSAPANGTDPAE